MPITNYPKPLKGFTIGADPELFLYDTKSGKYICADGLIPGTKAEPFKVPGGAVQVDGMAAEFNIDPVDTFEGFDKNITKVLATLSSMLPTGVQLVAKSSVVFDEDVWDAAPDHAKELGCSPDFNAWTGACNPPPSCPENPRLRTASGHVHYGWTNGKAVNDVKHMGHCQDFVKQLDFYLGLWSTTVDNSHERRMLYGKAGACRYKPYGVEYRVLSNFWVMDKMLRREVWIRSCRAMKAMSSSFLPQVVGQEMSYEHMQAVIDNNQGFDIGKFGMPPVQADVYAAVHQGGMY
jgi:hypothetical protein